MSEQFTAADAERFRTHHLAETSRLTREVLELRACNERLRAALEDARLFVSRQYTHRADKLAARIDEALATPSADPVVPHPPAEATARMP